MATAYDEEAQRLFEQARNAPYLAKGEDRELGLTMLSGGKAGDKARERLIASHERLVISIARQFSKSGKPLSELISDGKVGLVQAANKYDASRGTSFSTVATWWIRAAIQNSALGADDCADMPPSAKRKLYRIQQAERALLESGQEASDAAIARALKLSPVTVQRLRAIAPNAMLPTASLDELVGDGDTTLGELIADENSVDPDASVQHNQMKRALSLALSSLDERQRVVLSMRFGLVDDQEVTLQDLADRYGISCERVRQIEIRALAKLAAGPHAQLLRSILQA